MLRQSREGGSAVQGQIGRVSWGKESSSPGVGGMKR